MPSPRENPALWDYIVIGSTTLPPAGVNGVVRVSGTAKIKDDKKSPAGATGGRTTTVGLDLSEIEIELIWPDAEGQYDLVRAALDEIWPPPPKAQGIAHGGTDMFGTRDVQVRSITLPEWSDGKGSVKIGIREWKPDPVKGGGGGGKGGAGGTGAGSLADLKAKLAAAQAKLAAIKANNFQSETDVLVLQSEIASLQALIALYGSSTNTPSSTDPTTQFAKGGGIPLGEIQPADRVPLGEVQP